VQDGVYDAFTKRLAETAGAMKVADGFEPGVVIGPVIDMKAVEKVEAHIADALKKGAKVVIVGKPRGKRTLGSRTKQARFSQFPGHHCCLRFARLCPLRRSSAGSRMPDPYRFGKGSTRSPPPQYWNNATADNANGMSHVIPSAPLQQCNTRLRPNSCGSGSSFTISDIESERTIRAG